jgi:hypothetical protein
VFWGGIHCGQAEDASFLVDIDSMRKLDPCQMGIRAIAFSQLRLGTSSRDPKQPLIVKSARNWYLLYHQLTKPVTARQSRSLDIKAMWQRRNRMVLRRNAEIATPRQERAARNDRSRFDTLCGLLATGQFCQRPSQGAD